MKYLQFIKNKKSTQKNSCDLQTCVYTHSLITQSCVEARGQCQKSSSITFYCHALRQGLPLSLKRTCFSLTGWSELLASICSFPHPLAGVAGVCLDLCGYWGSKSLDLHNKYWSPLLQPQILVLQRDKTAYKSNLHWKRSFCSWTLSRFWEHRDGQKSPFTKTSV